MSNLSPEFRIEKISEPSIEFATLAQPIGFYAWRHALNRTEQEINMVFARHGIVKRHRAEHLLERMEDKSKVGKFAGAVALNGAQEIGYAWAADDVSGNRAQRLIKKAQGRKPYAWIAQINVLPEFHELGIGTALLETTLSPFDPDQKPTAYVFDENPRALDWFRGLSFTLSPDAPQTKTDYFGEVVKPVHQWRLEAPSVQHVLDQTRVEF